MTMEIGFQLEWESRGIRVKLPKGNGKELELTAWELEGMGT